MTASNSPSTLGTAAQLCQYTQAVLAQMVSVIQPYVGSQQPHYAAHVGAHMRHIIEHYDTLVNSWVVDQYNPLATGKADYDARERNLEVETNPHEAIRRIGLIEAAFGDSSGLDEIVMQRSVQIFTRGGMQGEHSFCTWSTLAREIMFLNSHATHHFAIMQGYARERGQTLGASIGKAPATVAHEQRLAQSQPAAPDRSVNIHVNAGGLQPTALPWQERPSEYPAPLMLRERLGVFWGRLSRWEFWPSWLYYAPIVAWIFWLGLKHRKPTAFTAANPCLESGGMVGEKKHHALQPLQDNAPDLVANFSLITAVVAVERFAEAAKFIATQGLPLVLKPDVGQRGRGVFVARTTEQVNEYLTRFSGSVIVQKHIEGEEFGIFVARMPGQLQPEVLSIVHKTFPCVAGDGVQTLRQLILGDARAKLISSLLFRRWASELSRVPAADEVVKLVEIGAHCRGSLFLDAREHATPELVATLSRLLDAVPGYAFGRMDVRVPSIHDFRQGKGIKVLELNGVSAESAHIYHPGTPLLDGYRAMFHQWSIAFEIGAAYANSGVKTTSALQLLQQFRQDLRRNETWF